MAMRRMKKKALAALNLDLFGPITLSQPQPSAPTMPPEARQDMPKPEVSLPDEAELVCRFDRFNAIFFDGQLVRPQITYSNRMRAAGSFTPAEHLIKIGRKYHEIFPEDIDDTLKHEMIHLLYFRHDADFKREARRLGTSLKARSHPSLRRPPKYVYICRNCARTYPRQKILRMASCGKCSRHGKYDKRYKLELLESRRQPSTKPRS